MGVLDEQAKALKPFLKEAVKESYPNGLLHREGARRNLE